MWLGAKYFNAGFEVIPVAVNPNPPFKEEQAADLINRISSKYELGKMCIRDSSQMVFRENTQPMVTGKNVILLMASITTGKTIAKGIECIRYYGGILAGISTIFSAIEETDGIHINSIFGMRDLPDYQAHDYRDCPFCQKGIKLDALVNSYGYSKL